MTPLEERIAEAIDAYTESGAVPGMSKGFVYGTEERDGLARAVVAVLPTADVDDEAIEAMMRGEGLTNNPAEFDGDIHSWRCKYPDRYGPCSCFASFQAAVRALLDAQAADHAAETARLREQLSAAIEVHDELQTTAGGLHAEVDALRAQIDRDRIRGAEAVLNEQLRTSAAEAEVEALRAEVEDLNARISGYAGLALRDLERAEAAEADRDAYRARIDKVRALCAAAEYSCSDWELPAVNVSDLRAALETK